MNSLAFENPYKFKKKNFFFEKKNFSMFRNINETLKILDIFFNNIPYYI